MGKDELTLWRYRLPDLRKFGDPERIGGRLAGSGVRLSQERGASSQNRQGARAVSNRARYVSGCASRFAFCVLRFRVVSAAGRDFSHAIEGKFIKRSLGMGLQMPSRALAA